MQVRSAGKKDQGNVQVWARDEAVDANLERTYPCEASITPRFEQGLTVENTPYAKISKVVCPTGRTRQLFECHESLGLGHREPAS